MKRLIIFLCVAVFGFFNLSPTLTVNANYKNSSELEKELSNSVINQIDNLDFSKLESYLIDANANFNLFNSNNISTIVKQIAQGNYFSSFSNVFEGVLNILFGNIKQVIPLIFIIIAIAILSSILNSLKSSNINNGVKDVIHFVCFSVVIVIIVGNITSVISITQSTLKLMSGQMEVIFPIMLTLLTAIGGITSVAIYKPIVSVLTSSVSLIFSKFLLPIFIVSFVFLIVGNLSSNIKLNKFNSFFASVFKWVVGFVFTLFGAFLTIQGISAGKFDGVSIKATKFAVKSYIPLIGGYISDGFDLILYSSVIIKNAVGVVGVILLFLTILRPIVQILTLKFAMQLVSAILEPIGEKQISNFTSSCAKILVYPIVLMLAVAFMYLLSVGLIMTTANLI